MMYTDIPILTIYLMRSTSKFNFVENGSLVVNQITTNRSNPGKTTTKHRFFGKNHH